MQNIAFPNKLFTFFQENFSHLVDKQNFQKCIDFFSIPEFSQDFKILSMSCNNPAQMMMDSKDLKSVALKTAEISLIQILFNKIRDKFHLKMYLASSNIMPFGR
jgi:hypothetical protein